ncbi:MAG: hypothetical protein AABY68_10000 [Pseudomonadota bacterium]
MSKHIGSSFDDFLKEEDIYEEVTTAALERLRLQQESNNKGRMKVHWVEDPQARSLLPPHPERPFEDVETQCIKLSLTKLDLVWARDIFSYIDRDGQSHGAMKPWKLETLKEGVADEAELPMPTIYTNTGDPADFQFAQGRHRTALARDLGETHAMFTVRTDQVEIFLAAFG